ncbi:GH116 family glycosyl hydrolase [Aliterella atlantica]|uniref:Bile acid beta-glucosidase n=1 Tax=Aliterella atlantica CENA595 TaxID=1618023 RepID=A0A0D8ZWF9_9CYAN|nr:GH116 family glycosyl hydrolase [Aliterella atlantica]KJH71576.1 bile acid beta-glucosidase [Aliterella atlantica CENA595]
MKDRHLTQLPPCTWNRPIGLGWDKPYTVRNPSNLDDGPWHGMPLGGFGAGCMGRSSKGDFNLWHIDGGEHTFQSVPACQFSVFEQQGDACGKDEVLRTFAYALCTEAPDDGSLHAWQWYPQNQGTYHALYPRSWFVYEDVFQSQLSCEQFSPILPENYEETSYPVAIFVWNVHNPTDKLLTLSIMLTWQNMVGWFTNSIKSPKVRVRDDGSPVYEYEPRLGQSAGNYTKLVEDSNSFGCVLGRVGTEVAEGLGQWAIATATNPKYQFHHTRWNPTGTGEDVWQSFSTDGSLPNYTDETPIAEGEQLASAIAIKFTLQPGESLEIPFVIAWDFPITEFAPGVNYYRRYTDFFGKSGHNAWKIATTALQQYQNWQKQVQDWQQPIVDRQDLPNWFKMALFNELYDLTSGGTLWSAADERDPIGQFAVLECIDYRWYESLDVRLYGSFALLMLWSKLDKSILRAYARSISTSDRTLREIGYNKATGLRKVANATPHDLGAPNEHPWEKTNYTSYQDCNLWKDLPSDFVLQVYRDFVLTGSTDWELLWDCWAAIGQTLTYLKTFDLDGDGIPENSGAPDQTFDDWRLQGVSAYCGGLWLAGLEAAIAIGKTLISYPPEHPLGEILTPLNQPPITETIATYQTWLEQSRPIYQEKLWNGQYYKLDSESGSDVVMADQLCGQFYARLLGLPDIVPSDRALSSLKTVYEACFLKFHNGAFGAANGLKIDGSPENPDATHPLEVWTGINFGIAAFLIQMGMKEEAFKLTQTVVQQFYDNGLQFRTPEAITAVGTFRACHYLRPMAIWAVYGVLDSFGERR